MSTTAHVPLTALVDADLKRSLELLAKRSERSMSAEVRRALRQHLDSQRIAETAERGGPCTWEGLNRAALTLSQLEECECARCAEWATARAPAPETAR